MAVNLVMQLKLKVVIRLIKVTSTLGVLKVGKEIRVYTRNTQVPNFKLNMTTYQTKKDLMVKIMNMRNNNKNVFT